MQGQGPEVESGQWKQHNEGEESCFHNENIASSRHSTSSNSKSLDQDKEKVIVMVVA
jgi:hypothetical protein